MPPGFDVSAEQWGASAKHFVRFMGDGPGTWAARHLLKYTNSVLPFSSATSILDVGCGTGQVTILLLSDYGDSIPHSVPIMASDMSPGMLEQLEGHKAEQVTAGATHWDRVEVKEMDAKNLSFVEDTSVSHLTGNFVYFLVPGYKSALAEAYRVLAPGGLFVETSWQDSEWSNLAQFIKQVRPDKILPQSPPEWTTEEGVKNLLEKAGFEDVKTEKFLAYMPFEDHEDIIRFNFSGMPAFRGLMADLTKEEVDEVYKLAKEWLVEKYPNVPARMVGTAILGSGRK